MTHTTIVVFESDWDWMRIERDRLRAENEELRSAIQHYTSCAIEECVGDEHENPPCVGHAAYEECATERDRLRAENEVLRVLLGESMDELECVYDNMYPAREEYPNEMRRYERDMDLVNRIRAALRGEGEK